MCVKEGERERMDALKCSNVVCPCSEREFKVGF